MTQPHDDERIASRADLLPEEHEFEVQDPDLLAKAVLAESDERTEHPEHPSSSEHPEQ